MWLQLNMIASCIGGRDGGRYGNHKWKGGERMGERKGEEGVGRCEMS